MIGWENQRSARTEACGPNGTISGQSIDELARTYGHRKPLGDGTAPMGTLRDSREPVSGGGLPESATTHLFQLLSHAFGPGELVAVKVVRAKPGTAILRPCSCLERAAR